MKILYLCADLGIPVLGRKGASVHVRALATALHGLGHRVVMAAPVLNRSPWDKPATVPFQLLQIAPLPESAASVSSIKAFSESLGVMDAPAAAAVQCILYNQNMARELKRQFANDPPDFIYERASLFATAGTALATELGVPLLLELNAPLAMEQQVYRGNTLDQLARQSERWILERVDAVFAVSAALRDYVSSLGVDASRTHVLPNAVDPEVFAPRPRDPAIRKRFRLDDRPVLGVIGGLRPWHGTESMPALVEQLVPRYRDLRLVIVGDGPLRTTIEREFIARGLQDHAVFTGAVPHDEVSRLVAEFDVALVPYTRPEHEFYFSPLKLFESMACAVPVVATAIGQIEEIVRDHETGLLCPPCDLQAMAAACARLLDDSRLRQRLGRAAADEVRGRYTWKRNADRVLDVARGLCRNREARP